MTDGHETRKIVLRELKKKDDYRYLGAEINQDGDLVFEGQDLGAGVQDAFGCVEYEWYWTIKAEDIPRLLNAFGSDEDILCSLKKRFSDEKAAGLYDFMIANNIPFQSWSRIGD